jgi:hypothetical protein
MSQEVKIPDAVAPTCGVKASLYTQYNLEDHLWNDVSARSKMYDHVGSLVTLFDDLLLLAKYIINVDGTVWMKTGVAGIWVPKGTPTDAKKDAKNCFMDRQLEGKLISSEMIDTFFSGILEIKFKDENGTPYRYACEIGSIPQLHGTIMIPYGPSFISYKGKKYLNVFVDQRLSSNVLHRDKGRLILRLIYRSLCNGPKISDSPELEMDAIERMVFTNNYSCKEFKFVMMWIAALYQRPGINLLTNLWIVGLLEGLGKGTLVTLLTWLIGRPYGIKFKQSEVEKGWTGAMMNKCLIEIDELRTDDRKSMFFGPGLDNWLKDMSINDEVTWCKRGFELPVTINVANYLITFNMANTVMDASNRRDTVIQTANDAQWVAYAAAIQERLVKICPEDTAAGLGWYLERVEIDYSFINRALMTEAKEDRIESEVSVAEEWVMYDESISRDGALLSGTIWYDRFKSWNNSRRPGRDVPTYKRFIIDLKRMYQRGMGGVIWKKDYKGTWLGVGATITTPVVDGATILNEVDAFIQNNSTTLENSELAEEFSNSFRSKEVSEYENVSKLELMRRKLRAEHKFSKDDFDFDE